MGTIYSRGTRATPRFYMYYREGSKADGSPLYRMKVAKGARNQVEAKRQLAEIETRIGRGDPAVPAPVVRQDMGDLLTEWAESITNRNAHDDRRIILRDLIPAFKGNDIADITVPVILNWLKKLKETKLSGQSQRHRLTYLSRFYSWAVPKGLAPFNPCLSVPQGFRPKPTRDKNMPWLEDDSVIPSIMLGLGPELGLMFYLTRFTGMRLGEVCGLRLSDMEWMAEGKIRVRYSYAGPLKEDRHNTGKIKWVPAPVDAIQQLGKLLEARRGVDGPEGLVFVYAKPHGKRAGIWKGWKGWHPKVVSTEFARVAGELGLVDLDWYRSSRHSFATKALQGGASLDEVSAALGHSNPAITKKYYSHFVRQAWSPSLTVGLTSLDGTSSGVRPSRIQ